MEDKIQMTAEKEKLKEKKWPAAVLLILSIFLLGVIVAFVFSSTQKAQALEFESISFAKLGISHFLPDLSTQGIKVIKTKDEWQDFLKKNGTEVKNFTAPKEYGFEKKVLLIAAAGQKSTGGYEMKIKSVEKDGGKIVVAAELSVPGANCQTVQVLTTPSAAILLARFWEEPSLVITSKTLDCQGQDIPTNNKNPKF